MAYIIGAERAKNKEQPKEKLERLTLYEIWVIITDKLLRIRFRIANLICGDYLRNYLAAVNARVLSCIDILERPYSDEVKLKYIDRKLRRAKKTLDEVVDF